MDDLTETFATTPPNAAVIEPDEDHKDRFWRADNILLVLPLQLLTLAAIIFLWEWGAGPRGEYKLIDEYYVSQPSDILSTLRDWWSDGRLWSNVATTLQTTIVGFVLGTALGLAFGFILGVSPVLARVLQPFVSAAYSIPRLALVPLFILWFGIGTAPKIALVVNVVMFLVFFATFAGVKGVDRAMIDRMRLMRARRWQVHLKVTLPSAIVLIIAGLRISAPYALVAAVTSEMLSSNRGVGYLLIRSSTQFHTAGVFAAITIMMMIGMMLLALVDRLERRLLRWKPDRAV